MNPTNETEYQLAAYFAQIAIIPELQKQLAEYAERIADLESRLKPRSLYSVKEVSEMFSLSETKIRELVAGGRLKRSFGTRNFRITAESVDAYLNDTSFS